MYVMRSKPSICPSARIAAGNRSCRSISSVAIIAISNARSGSSSGSKSIQIGNVSGSITHTRMVSIKLVASSRSHSAT
jgi:hypothetical protein